MTLQLQKIRYALIVIEVFLLNSIHAMLTRNIVTKYAHPRLYIPQLYFAHTEMCPRKPRRIDPPETLPKRAEYGGKVRLGFIPEEWFQFFYPLTGVSGPYFFGIMVTNYMLSKEIYVLEHEYYTGISIFIILYYVSTRFGKQIGKALDKQVDEYAEGFEKIRRDEIKYYENVISERKDSQLKAGAQKLLMDAKKENVAMQLEAAYRERMMQAYQTLKSRLDYQVTLKQCLAKIHQKWMIQWILDNVKKSITPDFEKKLLDSAISELGVLGDKVKRT